MSTHHTLSGSAVPPVFKARGQSMFPFVPDGSVLFFEPPDCVRLGDIVLIDDDDRWLAHRVVRIDHGLVTTWGDWNRLPDPPVAQEKILGRCVQIRRKGVDIHMDLPCVRAAGRVLARALPILKGLLPGRR